MFLGNDYQHGFEWLTAEFNGLRELFKRRDLTDVLLKKYGSLTAEVTGIRLLTSIEQGEFTFRHFALEWMLAQDAVCRNLSLEQEKQLFLLSFEHKKIKRQYADIFGNLNDIPANLLYAKKVMADPDFKYKSMEQRNALSDFIQSPVWIEPQTMESVEDFITVKFK
jgi:hypothetical protein